MQFLYAVAKQQLVTDPFGASRPVGNLASGQHEPDPRADNQQVGLVKQPGDLSVQLGGMPDVVVVATRDELAAGQGDARVPGARQARRPAVRHDPDAAAGGTEFCQFRLRRLLVMYHDALDRPWIRLADDRGERLPDQLRAPARGHDHRNKGPLPGVTTHARRSSPAGSVRWQPGKSALRLS